jgi:hypothetical protein
MEVGDQFHTLAILLPGKELTLTIGQEGLDIVEKRKMSCPCCE